MRDALGVDLGRRVDLAFEATVLHGSLGRGDLERRRRMERRDSCLRGRELVQVLVLQRGLLGLGRRLRKARFRRRGARLRRRESLAQELLGLRPRGRRRI